MIENQSLKDIQFLALVEAMDTGVVVVGIGKRILYLNPALLNRLGYRAEDLIGQTADSLLTIESRKILAKEWAKRVAGQGSSYELEFVSSQGQTIPYRNTATPFFDDQQQYAGSVSIMIDLSEIKQARGEIRRADDDWQHSFNAIEDIMMVTDQNRLIRKVNQAFCRNYQVTQAEVLGKKCFGVVHQADNLPDHCCAGEVFVGGRTVEFESERHLAGRTAMVSISPIFDDQGQISGNVHIIKDISESRKRELEKLRLNRELVQSIEGITQAMSFMLESRDPYTAGHSTNVAEMALGVGLEMGLDEEELRGLNVAALLHDVGKASIPLDILNKPGKLTEHEFGLIKAHPETAYKALSSISFPWPVAEVVRQHHERLDGSGYPLGLTGPHIHVWARILAVCDTVEAMTAHRPYRAALKRQDAFDVLEKGKGTHYDPLVVEAALASLGMADKQIMVVDDEKDILNLVSKILSKKGWQVSAYDDPAKAIEAFAASPCPVVLTDLVMPGLTGLDVLAKVKQASDLTEVILFTGYGEKEQVQAAMRLGAFDFLDKPFKQQAIISAVERARESYLAKT